jgi:uncharacterized protein (DUF1501 family)
LVRVGAARSGERAAFFGFEGRGDLFQGDLKFKVDFRSVYAGVLEGWLKTRSEPVLGRQFAPVQVV